MDFDETAAAYPTDGEGGAGTGSLSSASDLKDSVEWILDGYMVDDTVATERTITFKDSGGTTILTFNVPTTITAGETRAIGVRLQIYRGFTVESSHSECTGKIFYRNVRNNPSTA